MKLRSDDITWREIDGDLVILDLRTSTYLTTNASGALLMRELTEERSNEDLVDALMREFDLEQARAQSDVDSFLESLRGGGLLEQQPTA
ncbi:MAG: PqqD family protein [Propionibacterium sp.]|nr:PqqD family protein [Propionibacterium sp.]